MKRKILSVLLTVAMTVSVLAGCGNGNAGEQTDGNTSETTGDTQNSGTDASADSAEAVELETITVWSDQYHEKEIREKQIAEFNAGEGKELGIQIDYQVYGDGYTDTLRIAAQAGEAPDLYKADGKWLPEFVESEYAIPIEELPGSEELISQYSDLLANQAQIFNGKTYTLPYNMTTYGMVINTDLFEACGLTEDDYPTTWEEVREVAKIITEKSEGKAYGLGLSSTLWTVSSFYTFGAGQNVGHYGYDWDNKKFDYSAFNPLIETIDQIVADGSAFPGFEALDADGIRAQFAAGNIGIIGAASFDCAVYTSNFPATCNWKVIPCPKFSEDQKEYKRFGLATNLLCVGTIALEHTEKVLKVLEFFYDDKNMAEMYENGLYIPVRSEAVALATKEPEMNGWAEFAEYDEIFSMPPVPDSYVSVEGTTYREAIVNMWTNPELDNVESVMADVDKRYNDALANVDPAIVDLYVIPEGVSPEKGK